MYLIQPSTDETTQIQQQNTEHTEIEVKKKNDIYLCLG